MDDGQTSELDKNILGGPSSNNASNAYPGAIFEVISAPSRTRRLGEQWGNFGFVLSSLVMRDFKVRYRNMSLGVLWSLANPLIMMAVLTFVFIRVFPNTSVKSFPIFFPDRPGSVQLFYNSLECGHRFDSFQCEPR